MRTPGFLLIFWAMMMCAYVAGCVDGLSNECGCLLCDGAVGLTVDDAETQEGITNFVVEVVLNGESIGQPTACATRAEDSNSCVFGQDIGVYHVIVRAPGYETREAMVRIADEGSSEICCSACLSPKPLQLKLDPSR